MSLVGSGTLYKAALRMSFSQNRKYKFRVALGLEHRHFDQISIGQRGPRAHQWAILAFFSLRNEWEPLVAIFNQHTLLPAGNGKRIEGAILFFLTFL